MECLGFFFNVVIGFLTIYFILQTNNLIFSSIFKLFIDHTQKEKYSFRNIKDNFIFIDKLKQLIFIFYNFNLNSIDEYNKKISFSVDNEKDNLHLKCHLKVF